MQGSLNIPLDTHSIKPNGEAPEHAAPYLEGQRALMDRRFLLVRLILGLGVTGYLAVTTMLTAASAPGALLVLTSYLLANAGVWLLCNLQDCSLTRWLYAGVDVAFILLLRHFFSFSSFADPNITMAGLLALVLAAYTLYRDPKLSSVLSLGAMSAMGLTLWGEAAHTFAQVAPSEAVNAHSLRATLLMGYLAAFCLLNMALTLFMRQQTLNYLAELQKRVDAAIQTGIERAQRERLEELNTLKRNFLQVLSHELRTPITPLCSALELLQDDLRGHDAAGTLDIAQDATTQMQRLIHDYTQLAEVLGREEKQQSHHNIRLEELVDVLLERRQRPQFAVEDLDGLVAAADPQLLSGAFTALMRRAEFVTPPEQRITIRGCSDDGSVTIVIHDPASHLEGDLNEALDDPFAASSERLFFSRNTGLELTLAKHSLERTGGGLHVESTSHNGTTVTCTLPAQQHSAEWIDAPHLQSTLKVTPPPAVAGAV